MAIPQVHVVKGIPAGVSASEEGQIADISFLLPGGDRLCVTVDRAGLESLSHHIAHTLAQMPVQTARRSRTTEQPDSE